jgi:uncharacterized lipoprotein YehR (DUF1307 family)
MYFIRVSNKVIYQSIKSDSKETKMRNLWRERKHFQNFKHVQVELSNEGAIGLETIAVSVKAYLRYSP